MMAADQQRQMQMAAEQQRQIQMAQMASFHESPAVSLWDGGSCVSYVQSLPKSCGILLIGYFEYYY